MSTIPETALIALVTGANGGIGFAVVKRLASEHGFHVLLGSRNPENGVKAVAELQNQGLSVEPITLDITSDDSINAAVDFISGKFGRLDVLVNNAALNLEGGDPDGPPHSIPLRKLLEDEFAVNTFGAACTTEAFIPLLSKSSAPRIVFVSSNAGSLAVRAGPKDSNSNRWDTPVYRASKAALNMMMLNYAHSLDDKGFRINAACPGFTSTKFSNFKGVKTPEQGAEIIVRLATVGKDGDNGTFQNEYGHLQW
jgi:NAD(P)-dependent dehydrogenase (short-subunit alcohol dehydrogenase family)